MNERSAHRLFVCWTTAEKWIVNSISIVAHLSNHTESVSIDNKFVRNGISSHSFVSSVDAVIR